MAEDIEAPFGKDEEIPTEMEANFFWVKLPPWNWALTEDLDVENSKPYYNFELEGTFLDVEINCPFCDGQDSIFVRFGYVGYKEPSFQATEWCCEACGLCGQVVGEYGKGDISQLPSGAPSLPDEIYVSDKNDPKSGAKSYMMGDFSPPAYIVISGLKS